MITTQYQPAHRRRTGVLAHHALTRLDVANDKITLSLRQSHPALLDLNYKGISGWLYIQGTHLIGADTLKGGHGILLVLLLSIRQTQGQEMRLPTRSPYSLDRSLCHIAHNQRIHPATDPEHQSAGTTLL